MRKILAVVAFLMFLSSQTQGTMVTDGQYIVAHFENHKDAYIWWREAFKKDLIHDDMILVHVDAHHDMDCLVGMYYDQWLSTYILSPREVEGVTNATFIDAAVNEGLVGEIWWVMPDYLYWGQHCDQLDTFMSQGEPRLFYKYVRFCDCEREQGHIVCTLMDIHQVAPPLITLDKYEKTNVRVHFATLDMLPNFGEEVLLDIDIDYFINSSDISRYPEYFYEDEDLSPWISVETFMDTVRTRKIRSRVITIAVSPSYTHEEYYYLSWALTEYVQSYLSGIYSLCERRKSFSVL